jgi:excinuclease ABC subunit C
MRDASSRLEFELAGTYRDQLAAVESVREAQRVVSVTDRDQDVVGLFREADLVELVLLLVRAGRVVDSATFSSRRVELPDDEVVAAFLREHYGEGGGGETHIPDEVLLPVLPEGAAGVAEWLSERRVQATPSGERAPAKVQLLAPQRGQRRGLVDLAENNARHAYEEKRRAQSDMGERLLRVQERLRLPTLPRRIECADISHLGGDDTVGAVVALLDGKPDKKRYRTYNVRTAGPGDDYQAMYEVLRRRFRRGKAVADDAVLGGVGSGSGAGPGSESEPEPEPGSGAGPGPGSESEPASDPDWQLPDLFVVDGGRGQLGVALAAAHDLGIHDLCVIGLAKEKENELGDRLVDRVYLPGQKNPIPLRPNSPELYMLALARDEAHRFSNKGRRRKGKRRRFESVLDSVKGIGPKTKKALLKQLGTVEALRTAADDQILAVPGVTRRHLEAVRRWLTGGAE